MIKSLRFSSFSLLLAVIISVSFFSCGKSSKELNSKESQGNLGGSVEDASVYAKSKYGESVTLVYKGDINSNKKDDALALVINKKFGDTRYWIQKGSVIEKDDSGSWKTILWMEEKLKSTKGDLIQQVDAKNGYIISYDTSKSPVNFYISMADENGRPASDEATIKWNSKDSVYELSTGSSESSSR